MREIKGKLEGDLLIEKNTNLAGMVVGTAKVLPKVSFNIKGMLIDNLIVKNEAVDFVHGMVTGNIENEGGYVEVFGIVEGQVYPRAGKTIIHENEERRSCI